MKGIAGNGAWIDGKEHGGRRVSENERRATDTLEPSDLLVRGASVVLLLVIALIAVLSIQPIS